jgi:uncharacterized protein (UPF0333 family)
MKLLRFFLFSLIAFAFQPKAEAQLGPSWSKTFTVDTTNNAETINIDLTPKALDDLYYYSYHIQVARVSGTNTGSLYIQTTNARTGNYWRNVDTLAMSGSTTVQNISEGYLYGLRQRASIVTTGTGKFEFRIFAILRKRELP